MQVQTSEKDQLSQSFRIIREIKEEAIRYKCNHSRFMLCVLLFLSDIEVDKTNKNNIKKFIIEKNIYMHEFPLALWTLQILFLRIQTIAMDVDAFLCSISSVKSRRKKIAGAQVEHVGKKKEYRKFWQ